MPTRPTKKPSIRLSFGGTTAKKWAPNLAQGKRDARYWIRAGQTRVCIAKKLPSGSFKEVGCMTRDLRTAKRINWQPSM